MCRLVTLISLTTWKGVMYQSHTIIFLAKQDEISSMISDTEEVVAKIDPRIRAVYNGVKVILRNYRTGKLPKAFKVRKKQLTSNI